LRVPIAINASPRIQLHPTRDHDGNKLLQVTKPTAGFHHGLLG
jgi:hypothetical protein